LIAAGAEAQFSGSVHVGSTRSTSTYNNGRVESRSQGGSLNAYYGRSAGGGTHAPRNSGSSPYGRLNYGRGPGYDYGDPGAPVGYAGPHSSTWSGSIDQNFAQMRRTSPHPWGFAGGAYNPHPSYGFNSYYSPSYYYPSYGNYSYDGYAFSYAPAYYGGYVPSVYAYYGSWYPQYLPVERVYIIERERVGTNSSHDAAPRERYEDSDQSEPSQDGDYYLSPKSGRLAESGSLASESLEDTIAAIRSAWMNGDTERLVSRIVKKGKVRIYLKGKYKYSVDAADFGQMSRDAMARIDTVSFTLDRVQKRGADRAFVSGKHTYYDPDRKKHEVYVSYVLVREQGQWRIAEAGSSTEPITTHGE